MMSWMPNCVVLIREGWIEWDQQWELLVRTSSPKSSNRILRHSSETSSNWKLIFLRERVGSHWRLLTKFERNRKRSQSKLPFCGWLGVESLLKYIVSLPHCPSLPLAWFLHQKITGENELSGEWASGAARRVHTNKRKNATIIWRAKGREKFRLKNVNGMCISIWNSFFYSHVAQALVNFSIDSIAGRIYLRWRVVSTIGSSYSIRC